MGPQRFRAIGTGCGQTSANSEVTGAARAQRVIDGAPKSQRKVADPSYPAPTGRYDPLTGRMHHPDTGVIMSPLMLTRAG